MIRVTFVIGLLAHTASAEEKGWLSLCGKCPSPSITSKSGMGTANAVAEARLSRKDAETWCASWEPDRIADCVRDQMASDDAKQTYRATADCTRGRITAVDGVTYTQAGVWTSDVGKGLTRWRDATGAIVGQDHASNGLAIAQQWAVLCPAVAPKTERPAATAPSAGFAVGEMIEAKFGREWVRGKVTKIRSGPGARVECDVALDNGQRGILPATMLRKAR